MKRHFLNHAFSGAAGILTALSLVARAGEPVPAAEDFVVVNEPVSIPERGIVAGHCVLLNGHRFSFIPPVHWRMESNRGDKSIIFTRQALDAAISLRFLPAQPEAKEEEEAERYQRLVKERYPDGEIIRRFVCHTGSHSGVGFDLQQDFGRGMRLERRVAFVSYDKGVIEVSQTGLSGTVENAYEDFGAFLTSLRINVPTVAK